MDKKNKGEICPTCGQIMKHMKSHIHSSKISETDDNEEISKPKFKTSEIWHCLNCSEEWQIDIMDNIWRKKDIKD